jgi:hypothetical protein
MTKRSSLATGGTVNHPNQNIESSSLMKILDGIHDKMENTHEETNQITN